MPASTPFASLILGRPTPDGPSARDARDAAPNRARRQRAVRHRERERRPAGGLLSRAGAGGTWSVGRRFLERRRGASARGAMPRHPHASARTLQVGSVAPATVPLAISRPDLAEDVLAWQPDIVHFHSVHIPQNVALGGPSRSGRQSRTASRCTAGCFRAALRRGRLKKALFSLLFERRYLNDARFIHAVSPHESRGDSRLRRGTSLSSSCRMVFRLTPTFEASATGRAV